MMNNSSSNVQETQGIDDYTAWFNYGSSNTGEEPASLFDICHLYPVSDLESPPEEMDYQSELGERPKYDCRYWLSEYDSCYGGYWGENLFSTDRYSADEAGCNDPMKTEDSNHSEDQYQSYTSYFDDDFTQPNSDYNPWSCHQYCEDNDSYSYNEEEPRTIYSYRMDELGLCDGIFGYFPCLLREQQHYNREKPWTNA